MIKGSFQSGGKVVAHDSMSDLPLSLIVKDGKMQKPNLTEKQLRLLEITTCLYCCL